MVVHGFGRAWNGFELVILAFIRSVGTVQCVFPGPQTLQNRPQRTDFERFGVDLGGTF